MQTEELITTRFDEAEQKNVATEASVNTDAGISVEEYELMKSELKTEEYKAETSHEGPHIMWLKADYLPGLPITTTNFTSILFLFLILALALYAKSVVTRLWGGLRTAIVSFVDVSYQFLIDSFDGDRAYARKYYPLIMWVFVVILFGNLFGLVIDWFGFSIPSIHYYFRPIFSDLASTIPFAVITVVYSLYIASKAHGVWHTAKGYLFNWSWNGVWEKAVNVFVGWLHLVGVPSSVASLALRLFGNIFAGVVLIAVLGYLWRLATEFFFWVGVLLTLPFRFFEIFVAFVQAAVFAMLMVATFKQAHEAH